MSVPPSFHQLHGIELPAGARVPAGALQKVASADGSRRALLSRSTCETPLPDQLRTLSAAAKIMSKEMDDWAAGNFLIDCFNIGMLREGAYTHAPDEHPANVAGLACRPVRPHS